MRAVVLVGLAHREPEEEADEEDHPDDRHVVRQGRDLVEVRVEVREADPAGDESEEDSPPFFVQSGRQRITQDQPDQARRTQVTAARQKFDRVLDELDDATSRRPEMPDALLTRQKWTAIRNAAMSGSRTQCST
jgi:hypothetical protein